MTNTNYFTARLYYNERYQTYKNPARFNAAIINGTLDVDDKHKWVFDLVAFDVLKKHSRLVTQEIYDLIMEASNGVLANVPTCDLLASQLHYYSHSAPKEAAGGFVIMDATNRNLLVALVDENRRVCIEGIYPINEIRAAARGRKLANFIASNIPIPLAA